MQRLTFLACNQPIEGVHKGHRRRYHDIGVGGMAFVNALNRLVAGQERQSLHPQKDPVVLDARPTL